MRQTFLERVAEQRESEQRAVEEQREWEPARRRSRARRTEEPPAAPQVDGAEARTSEPQAARAATAIMAWEADRRNREATDGYERGAVAANRRRPVETPEHTRREAQRMGTAAGRLLKRGYGFVLGWSPPKR